MADPDLLRRVDVLEKDLAQARAALAVRPWRSALAGAAVAAIVGALVPIAFDRRAPVAAAPPIVVTVAPPAPLPPPPTVTPVEPAPVVVVPPAAVAPPAIVAPAKKAVGTALTIVCTPTCDDIVDNGASMGQGKIFNRPVSPGRHALVLSANGEQKNLTVEVPEGTTPVVRVAFGNTRGVPARDVY